MNRYQVSGIRGLDSGAGMVGFGGKDYELDSNIKGKDMGLTPELAAAIAILKKYSCIETPEITSAAEREELRQNIVLACKEADWENIGICAENAMVAVASVRQYLKALGYKNDFEIDLTASADKPVYLKFNTQKMSHYLSDYEDKYRGVLIALQSDDEALTGTFGHFPLDLFA